MVSTHIANLYVHDQTYPAGPANTQDGPVSSCAITNADVIS